ncbi:MAG: PP2C family protein-serine/threonine phosphatase [Candidatus Krumholzibacteriia bacterium]
MTDGFRRSWERLTEGMRLQDIWAEFRMDARDGYAFYSRDLDDADLEARSRWRRPLTAARILAWAMLRKLSPARRLLLIAAAAFALMAILDVRLQGLPQELEFLIAFLLVVGLLALELADRVAMKRDLELAREIQRWLLPPEPPVLPGVDVAFATRPANTVGGDFYDGLVRNDAGAGPQLLVAVADVAGKSVPAALLMAHFGASFRALVAGRADLVGLVRALNVATCARSNGGRRFVTAFLAGYDPRARRLTYVGAGHNPPLLRRTSGELEVLAEGGIPLGMMPDAEYPAAVVTLAPGDLLVVYTDGVVDAIDGEGIAYGDERLRASVRGIGRGGAADAVEALTRDVQDFTGPARQLDDITWLVLRAN